MFLSAVQITNDKNTSTLHDELLKSVIARLTILFESRKSTYGARFFSIIEIQMGIIPATIDSTSR